MPTDPQTNGVLQTGVRPAGIANDPAATLLVGWYGWLGARAQLLRTEAAPHCKNDPVAGSPTTTLLRLHLPLSFKIWETSLENIRQSRQNSRSEYLTGKLNR